MKDQTIYQEEIFELCLKLEQVKGIAKATKLAMAASSKETLCDEEIEGIMSGIFSITEGVASNLYDIQYHLPKKEIQ